MITHNPRKAIFFILTIGVLVLSGEFLYAEGDCLSEREKILIQRIEDLEKKVKELENLINNVGEKERVKVERGLSSLSEEQKSYSLDNEKTIKEENSKKGKVNTELKPVWKDRLTFRTEDKSFEVQVGGRLHLDWAFFDNDKGLKYAFGEEEDGVQFRRARIDFSGKIYENVQYRMEFDFAGDRDLSGKGKFTDVYITFVDFPYLGNLQVGHYREPFGLERLTNNNYITFLERGLNDTFTPKRNVGFMAFDSVFDNRFIWQAGIFKETDDFPSDDDTNEDKGYSFTGRIVYLPLFKNDGKQLLHLGLAYSYRDYDGIPFRYKTQPECALAYTYLDTDRYEGFRLSTDALVDDVNLVGSELLFIYGPWSLQGEYMTSFVDTYLGGNQRFSGGYLYTSYFLTKETRAYNRDNGILSRIRPINNFDPKSGKWGAWEVGLRYSWIDLNSEIIRGGEERNWTLGLNWYLNPNTRLMLNYTRADIQHDLYEGVLDIFQTRFQIDF
ncbi:MAG: porin [Candidatus Hydrogenedentes bacterium]|nr:porin [Candidatus Hydrogenedentota bacterium]